MYSVVRFTKINIKKVKIYYAVSRVTSGRLKIGAILDKLNIDRFIIRNIRSTTKFGET